MHLERAVIDVLGPHLRKPAKAVMAMTQAVTLDPPAGRITDDILGVELEERLDRSLDGHRFASIPPEAPPWAGVRRISNIQRGRPAHVDAQACRRRND